MQTVRTPLALILYSAGTIVYGQTLNPPYPRLGIQTFSAHTYAAPDILKDFDVIAAVFTNEQARRFKQANPNVILLGPAWADASYDVENQRIVGDPPEAWFMHDSRGNRLVLWAGAWVMNITRFCPRVDLGDGAGAKTWIEHVIAIYRRELDFTVWDGMFHDWWWPILSGFTDVDVNNNRVPDAQEGINVNEEWRNGLIEFHRQQYAIPGLKYVVVNVGGEQWAAGVVNGMEYEDWPDQHGQWNWWYEHHALAWENDANAKKPQIFLLDASMSPFNDYGLAAEPYKNTYRAVRFALGSALLTSSYLWVDEGNALGHHGNVHIYDEFEGKGKLGYPLGAGVKLPNKALASTPYASGVWVRFFENGVSVVNVSGLNQTVTASELAALDPVSGSKYYRFQGGQDPVFNNGREVTDSDPLTLWGTTVTRHWPDPDPVGDGTMLFRQPTTLITPIIVDNNVNNQTSPGSDPVTYTGNWVLSSNGDAFYAFYIDRNYKSFEPHGFAYSASGNGENVATYVPTIGVPGYYEVFEWHGWYGNSPESTQEATNVPCIITDANGQVTKTIDQSKNYGRWNSLGVYLFSKGKSGNVKITNRANGIVLSDAIKFVFRGTNPNLDLTPPEPPRGLRIKTP